ncbi:hypothetical protein BJ138DRAFT_1151963 [Hygrophoropsis aurantiaca]|uniref:Uncharacterized protein n=1 Tax=Hygrophoropsis aurantiaca TaxID=72124 RepID=A0ACB8ADG3_9AGAM|nr:hypothetical protein BJ138DRAFT_1151963 [Hygrophoropsis aurantiaca]
MGFFSSKKAEDTSFLDDDRSVVQVIRSRFYGKYKGKDREVFPAASSSPQLSYPASRSMSTRNGDRDTPRKASRERTPFKPLGYDQTTVVPALRAHTDIITSTLAQRLNELATANSQGLLNDDEYRLLRQNIFERLASGSSVPTEAPVVPIVSSSHSQSHTPSHAQSRNNISSHFQVNPVRSPSVRTKSSVSSAMSTLFRRGSRRRMSSLANDGTASDASSIFSLSSSTSNIFQRRIPSDMRSDGFSSAPEPPRTTYDTPSTSPQKRGENSHSTPFLASGAYRSMSRSVRRLGTATPPSSFPGAGTDPRHSPSPLSAETSPDDELKSSHDIRLEIEAMEAEGRRLLDAFNGLELSALTRSQQRPGHALPPRSPSVAHRHRNGQYEDSFLTAGPGISGRGTPLHGSDNDGLSIRSNTSYGTSLSQPRSHRPQPSIRTAGLSAPLNANRKRSMSSLSSRARITTATSSPVHSPSRLRNIGSVSSVNLARGATPADEEEELSAMETELEDIRRRRGEVTARYQSRLEYLRAQLKGAELREKLLRR